jgi:shikimate dehydrogenase
LVGSQSFCYDLVYGTADTPFVLWAKNHGAARAVNGWGMLVDLLGSPETAGVRPFR